MIQDKETTAKLYGCAKQWSISCGINTLNDHKILSSVQDQAYVKGYESAIDKAVADVKNMPESVQQAYKLLKEDPKAFGSAMLQALKDLPAEYKDKLDKVTNAKLRATTPAEFAAAGKAEAELRIEFAGAGVGGAGIGKTGLKVVEKTTRAINDLKKAEEIKKAESIAKRKQEIENNFYEDGEIGFDWTSTKKASNNLNLAAHWQKHKTEFPNLKSQNDYYRFAQNFVTSPPSDTLIKIRKNGDSVFYQPNTNTFAVKTKDGLPRTIFKPDPKEHGYPSNLDYFNAQ